MDATTDPAAGTVDSGGYRLRYFVEGKGLPALFLGFPDVNRRLLPPQLKAALRVAYVDHRVSARAHPAPQPGDFLIARLVEDIELLRAELALPPFVILAHSGNALLALEYAKRHPQQVTHVVMICVAPDLSPATMAAGRQRFETGASPERQAALARNRQRWPDAMFATLPPDEALLLGLRREAPFTWHDPDFDPTEFSRLMLGANLAGFAAVWGEQLAAIDIRDGLHRLAAPVFLALGRHDYNFAEPPACWDALRPHFKDLTVHVFENSGHTPQYEEAGEFSRVLLDWLARHPATPS
jgi:proline iminopeptidase